MSKNTEIKYIADGRDDEVSDGKQSDVQNARDLEEILGVKEINPFKTSCAEDFEKELSDMSLNDLRSLAVKSGVFPSGNKASLKNKLRKEFKLRAIGGVNRAPYQGTSPFSQETEEKVKNIAKGKK